MPLKYCQRKNKNINVETCYGCAFSDENTHCEYDDWYPGLIKGRDLAKESR